MGKKLTSSKVAQHLDTSVKTLNNWYRWYNGEQFEKPENTPILPPYEQSHPMGVRYWDSDDLPLLEAFQKWIPKGPSGVMGSMNVHYWGKRGKALKKYQNQEEK